MKWSLIRSVLLSVAAFTGFSLFVGAFVVPHEVDRLITPEEVSIRSLVIDEQQQTLLAYCACTPRNNEAATHYQLSTQRLDGETLDPHALPIFGKPVRACPIPGGMIVGEADGTLRRLSGVDGKHTVIGTHSNGRIWKMACSPDGRVLMVWDFFYSAWDLTTNKKLCELPSAFRVAAIAADSRTFYCDLGSFVIERDLLTGETIRQISRPGEAIDITVSPDGRQVATFGSDRRIQLSNLEDASLQWERCVLGRVSASRMTAPLVAPVLKFSPDGKRLLCAHEVEEAKRWGISVWNTHSGVMEMVFEAHSDRIAGAQFAGPHSVYTWAEDCKLRKWELKSSDALLVADWNTTGWRTRSD